MDLEVRVLRLERHRPVRVLLVDELFVEGLRHSLQFRPHVVVGAQVLLERHLRADRLRGARRLDDLFGVAAHRHVVQVLAERPEELDEILAVVSLDVRDRLEANLFSRSAVFGPTPRIFRTEIGARKATTSSGATTVSPSGFWRSEAIFAIAFVGAIPIEQVRRCRSRIATLISRARSCACEKLPPVRIVTSRNPSSIPLGCSRSAKVRRVSMISPLTRPQSSKCGGTKTACGPRRDASTHDIADRTPYWRAS